MLLATEKQIAVGLLLFRVAFGALMLVHGVQKMMNYAALSGTFPDPIGMGSQLSLISAIAAEAGCSVLLIFGAAARLAVIPLAFTMTIAAFVVHSGDPWKTKELAVVYLAAYIALFFTGPGRFSVDSLFSRRIKVNA
jgi:putative oxidoreductase